MEAPKRIWPIGGFAPGNYMCICGKCGGRFEGDKRAYRCPKCVLESYSSEHDRLMAEKDAEIARLNAQLNTAVSGWSKSQDKQIEALDRVEKAEAEINDAYERAALKVAGLTHAIRIGRKLTTDEEEVLILRPIRECAAAIRAMKGEKPFDILPEGHSVVRQEGTGGADFSGSVRAMKGE